jgi:hypothetical protein
VRERDETDGDPDDADDPPFDVVQAVSDFVETVIVESDTVESDTDEADTDTRDDPDDSGSHRK